MKKIIEKILPLFIILVVASLACSAPLRSVAHTPTSGSDTSATSMPVMTQTAETPDFALTATAVSQSKPIGTTTITITEAQLNTYIKNQIASQPDLPFKNPVVVLKEGEILVTGDVTMGPISSQANITLQPYVDQNNLKIKILSAKLGAFPFPEDVLKNLDQMINQNLSQLVTQNNVELSIQDVTVSNGLMTVTGTAK